MKPPFVTDINAPRISSSPFHTPMKPDSVTTAHTESEMNFQGPGRGDLTGSVDTSTFNQIFDNTIVNINVKLSYSREEQPIVIQTSLGWRNPTEDKEWILGRWVI